MERKATQGFAFFAQHSICALFGFFLSVSPCSITDQRLHFFEPCCTGASVSKHLQASGIERGRSSVQEHMKAEHWTAKQVICG